MFCLDDFEKIDNFCNMDNDFDFNSNSGYAYRLKNSKKVYCLKDCNLERGRGKPIECEGSDCEYYIFIDPNQTLITDFFEKPSRSN